MLRCLHGWPSFYLRHTQLRTAVGRHSCESVKTHQVIHDKAGPIRRCGGSEPTAFSFGNTGPRQNDTVERIPSTRNDRPTRRIDCRSLGWIIELSIKHGQIAPPAVPWRPVRPAYSGLNRQLLRCFPIVLDKQVGGCRHPWSHRLRARFRVIAEKTEKGIADPQSAAAGAIVKEAKSPVLVIRDRRRSGCQLN